MLRFYYRARTLKVLVRLKYTNQSPFKTLQIQNLSQTLKLEKTTNVNFLVFIRLHINFLFKSSHQFGTHNGQILMISKRILPFYKNYTENIFSVNIKTTLRPTRHAPGRLCS